MRKRYFTALFFITLLIPGIVDSQVLLSKEIKNHSIFSTEEFGSNSQLKNNELVSTKSYRWSKTTSSLYHPLYPQYGSPSLKAGFPPGRKILNIIHVLVESEHYMKEVLMNEDPIIDYAIYEAVSNLDQLNVEKNLGYLYHYIVGFRLYADDDPDNLVLDIDSIRKDRYKSLNTGVLGIYPSIETGQFYINDYSGLYIFEKQSTKHNNISMMKDKKPVILSSKNYPNPFNPQTTIEFELKENAHVSLKIYNALGQEIASLMSENLMKGKYNRTWNASNVASGVYFYRLIINVRSHITSESFSIVERLILLK